jgi:HD-GYP domain-containing protein (c-di-GMP phosphodiesterase class II)
MSSAQQGDGPSPPNSAEEPATGLEPAPDLGLIELLRARSVPLLEALESHLPASRERSEAASSYAFAVAVELGMGRENAELARDVARVQDVGHVYIPAEVLATPASERDASDQELLASHYEKGAQLARGAGLPDQVCEWIRLGGERYDGTGPNGVAGSAIPAQARISRAAYACYEALAAAQADPEGPSPDVILRERANVELDPRLVNALASVLERVG